MAHASVRWVMCRTPKVSRQVRCAVNSASFMTTSAGNRAAIETRALSPRLKVSSSVCACWLYRYCAGAKSVNTLNTVRRSFFGGGEVGGEQWATHNLAILVNPGNGIDSRGINLEILIRDTYSGNPLIKIN